MLGIPLILGAVSLSYAPAAVEPPGDGPEVASQNLDPDPLPLQTSSQKQLHPELLFKTTPPSGAPLNLPNPEPTPPAKNTPISALLTQEPANVFPPTEMPPLRLGFLADPIPPENSGTFPPLDTTGLLTGLEDITDFTQVRRKGPFLYSLKINTFAIYDDNISLSKNNQKHGLLLGLGPALRLQLGASESSLQIAANYTGAGSYLTETPQNRTYDQNLGVGAEWSGNRLHLTFRTGVNSNHNSSLDAGERTGRTILYAGSTASYQVGGKTTADLSGDLTQANFEKLLNSTEYRIQEYFNYQWTPKLQWGLGTTQGLVTSDSSARQTYIQALVRLVAALSGKFDVNASAGNEWRNYESGTPGTSHPVFSAGATWQATGKTNFSVEARRRTFASAALEAQNYESTSTSISVHEALTPSLNASLTLGMETAHYSASSPGTQSDRSDSYLFSRIGLEWFPRRNCSVGTFYETSENDSKGTQGNSFRRNRMGVSLTLNF